MDILLAGIAQIQNMISSAEDASNMGRSATAAAAGTCGRLIITAMHISYRSVTEPTMAYAIGRYRKSK
ncbi:MAG: hypothetical protein ACI8RN_002794 [Glaciecola sp.]|jgi:hypothetical protein|uniref:hypothetical protein n=1 Tax=Congregibacter sp. TaxID=2744308 RepID=UPI0039E4C037